MCDTILSRCIPNSANTGPTFIGCLAYCFYCLFGMVEIGRLCGNTLSIEGNGSAPAAPHLGGADFWTLNLHSNVEHET